MEPSALFPCYRNNPIDRGLDRCLSRTAPQVITMISLVAIGSFSVLQGFLSPMRDPENSDYSQLSYKDISPLAITTGVTSLVYLWPIISLFRKVDNRRFGTQFCTLFCGLFITSIFFVYRLGFCGKTRYPEYQTLDQVADCKKFISDNQEKFINPDCLLHPVSWYTDFCEVSFYDLNWELVNCFVPDVTEYWKIAHVDRYEEYKSCWPTTAFMGSDATQYTILAINLGMMALGAVRIMDIILGRCRNRNRFEELDQTV